MPRLLLIRHAKSSWDDPAVDDFERPLNERGRLAAPAMGRLMQSRGWVPGRVLCSSARRTRETLGAILPELQRDAEVKLTKSLYETTPARYLETIRSLGDVSTTLLVVGHNPSIQELAISLISSGEPLEIAELVTRYPTATLTVIDLPASGWGEIEPRSGRLVAYVRPRDVDKTLAGD